MSKTKTLFEVEGFDVLQKKIKRLGKDKSKRKEVLKILGQVANPTLKAARRLAPVSSKAHYQKRKGQIFGVVISPGTGKRSLGKQSMKRASDPMIYVSPTSTKRADGWYLRQFVLRGTKKIKANPFLDKAYQETKGGVVKDAEKRVARYFQKRIDSL
ncbi:conserved protein of unknown function [Tenacibaculum sp. 190524A02b]|uniref:HK97-gp10 family putative phage morphogenesis protein n=1 Tax=Tenacibaculum vairaonense TaxID=3137860 RepID=UPI0032B1063B